MHACKRTLIEQSQWTYQNLALQAHAVLSCKSFFGIGGHLQIALDAAWPRAFPCNHNSPMNVQLTADSGVTPITPTTDEPADGAMTVQYIRARPNALEHN
jgi:hypothetical protein